MANIGKGRPLKFATPEDLQNKVDEYFRITKFDDYIITGLALHLDTTRDVLMDYENGIHDIMGVDYSNIIKKAKSRIQSSWEVDLKKQGKAGHIFALKQFGWRDKQEVDLNVSGKLDLRQLASQADINDDDK